MKRSRWKKILILQLIVIIYTLSGIMAKFASFQESILYAAVYIFLDFVFLGIYALCWQQMIKKMPLSVAYLNRAMSLAWSALWAVLIFQEEITKKQILSVILVTVGIIIVNREREEQV